MTFLIGTLFCFSVYSGFVIGISATGCPNGWTVFDGSCYLFSHETVDYDEARHFCAHHGAGLIHIDSEKENAFVDNHVTHSKYTVPSWIGLTDSVTEGVFILDGTNTTASFFHWFGHEPNQGRVSNCVAFYTGHHGWIDEPCTNRKYEPICERPVYFNVTLCPDGWVAFQMSCYLFSPTANHFTEAEELCRQHGSHLVNVGSPLENSFIKSTLRDLKPADHWLGLTDEVIDGVWTWYDTDVMAEYTDWYPGQPDQARNADCAVFKAAFDFRWVDDACSILLRKPVCEINYQNSGVIVG